MTISVNPRVTITLANGKGANWGNHSRNGDCVNGQSRHTLDTKHKTRIANIEKVGGYGKVMFVFKEQFAGHEPRYKKITSTGVMSITNALYDEDYTTITHNHEINSIICRPRDINHFIGMFDEISRKVIYEFPRNLMVKAMNNARSGLIELTER